MMLKMATVWSCLGQDGVGHGVCNKNAVGELWWLNLAIFAIYIKGFSKIHAIVVFIFHITM